MSAQKLSAWMWVMTLVLGGIGITLHAADEKSTPPAAAGTPRDVLDPLLEKSDWQPQWVEDLQAHKVVFKGPDVYIRVAGDYVLVQSYLGRLPKTVSANDLLRVLRRNYDLYEGKFAVDKDMDLWFEIVTAKRLLDAEALNQQVAFVADAAQDASQLIKMETPPATSPRP
jgi:hypothetical protein